MRRVLLTVLISLCAAFVLQIAPAGAQITPPAPGVELPRAYFEVLEADPTAFTMQRAWIAKAQRAAEARQFADDSAGLSRAGAARLVQGAYNIPIFTVAFSNTGPDPYPTADLYTRLFDVAGTELSLSDFYTEISYGNVSTLGSVYGWTALAQPDTVYAGTSNGLNPANAKIGELIKTALDAYDAGVDFGQFDNDGPDGVPNSGDDDGYVDFVAFVHPEQGGECGGNDNIWSHRWVYRGWPASNGIPYITNDASLSGGSIRIDDYTIQPAFSCAAPDEMIEIGVFCHEFGHAFGLPDLYDTNGGAQGIGSWGLMGTGNWNRPASPAHMSAWSKAELGWVEPIAVSWEGAVITLPPVETNPVVYELSFTDDRWQRRQDCALSGSWSMALGLDDGASSYRGWVAGKGYGNDWRETLAHDFHYDGNGGPVMFGFQYQAQSESAYDYTYLFVEVGGAETLLAAYDAGSGGSASFDLTAHLVPGPTNYRMKFRFASDAGWADEDGGFDAGCAAFLLDSVSLSGGGEGYYHDFEDHRGGWFQPRDEYDNPRSEVWFVENRQNLGSDQHVHGEGLLIYHVDQEVAHSALGNTGGTDDTATRGVCVEQADGNMDLELGVNRGDAGDVWPGTTSQFSFDGVSSPSSNSNDGESTTVSIVNVIQSGNDLIATMTAGDPAPLLAGVWPGLGGDHLAALPVDLLGEDNLIYGASLKLVRTGAAEIVADLDWQDADVATATLDLRSQLPGQYDVVIENPDGQTAVIIDGFTIEPVVGTPSGPADRPLHFALGQNFPNPFNPVTTIRYELPTAGWVSLRVLDVRGRVVRKLVDGPHDAGFFDARWNGTDDAGQGVASGVYFYRMEGPGFSDQKKLLLAK